MPYTLRNKKYANRPARYCDSDWVTEFPRPQNPILYWQWIGKLRENEEPLGHKPKMIGLFHDGWASSDDEGDGFEDCDCGYTHHYEDKCPNEATAHHYKEW